MMLVPARALYLELRKSRVTHVIPHQTNHLRSLKTDVLLSNLESFLCLGTCFSGVDRFLPNDSIITTCNIKNVEGGSTATVNSTIFLPYDYWLINLSQDIIFAKLINDSLIKRPKLQQTINHATRTQPKSKNLRKLKSIHYHA